MPSTHEVGITVRPATAAAELGRLRAGLGVRRCLVVGVLPGFGDSVSGMRRLAMVGTRVLGGVTDVTGSGHGAGL